MRHTKQMLRNKIFHFKKIYNFYFDHFLTKRTVFVLIVKSVIKNQIFNFPDKLRHTIQMLRNKIVRFKKIYKFYFDHFLIKCTVFILILKNVIKNQKFNFPDKHIEHFLIGIIVFLVNIKNAIK